MPDAPLLAHTLTARQGGWPSLPYALELAMNETNGLNSTDDGGNHTNVTESFMQTYDTGTFLASMWTNIALVLLWFLLWNGLRRVVKAVYEPRTYIPPRDQQAPPLGTHWLKPIWKILNADPEEILNKNGVDPYVFVRFLRLLMKAMIPIWLVSWIVLLPVNSVGGASRTGLDMFAMANMANEPKRYWAHLCLAYLFNAWIMTLLWMEMKVWLKTRQEWLVSPKHSRTAQASTVLITGIPEELMDEEALTKLYSYLPGGVYRVWLQRDLKDMPKLWQQRTDACQALEKAQVALIRTAHRIDEKVRKLEEQNKPVPETLRAPPKEHTEGSAPSPADFVPDASRPKFRVKPKWAPFSLGWLGIGEKIDAITYYRKEVEECTKQLTAKRRQLERDILTPGNDKDYYKPLSSAFICFNQQIAAHMAKVFLPYGQPYRMAHRYIELSPENVIWGNMGIKSDYELNLRTAVSFLITAGLVIAFIFPVVLSTFVLPRAANTSIVGNVWGVGNIAVKGEGFGPKLLLGLLTGLVPPILLMLILMIAPTLLRQLAKLHNFTKTQVELDVMDRYFAFLIIERFLIPTIATLLPEGNTTSVQWWPDFSQGASKALQKAFEVQLPQASTFYITLLLLQVTGQFVQLFSPITLIIYYSKVILGSGTPRSFYNARYKMNNPQWGSDWPNMTVYFVILIVYMVIAPVINGFGAILAVVAYHVYKYLYLWVLEQKTPLDTGGEFFPRAVTHVFVGIYIGELALTIIFFGKGFSTLPQAILMIILIVATLAVQYMMVTSYRPLLQPLPLSLAHLTHGQPSADAKAGPAPMDDKSYGMNNGNGAPAVDPEEAMWYGDLVAPTRPGLAQRRSSASMRSWSSAHVPASPRHRASKSPLGSPKGSPVLQSLALPPTAATVPGPALVPGVGLSAEPEPPAMHPDDVEMSNFGTAATRHSAVESGTTAVEPSPTSPTSRVSPASPTTPTSDAHTDEYPVTEDHHSAAPVNRPAPPAAPASQARARRPSFMGMGRKRAKSVAPWEDHRHTHMRQLSAPHWELRRTSTIQSLESNQEDISRYFARPGGPGVIRPPDDSAAPAAFFHPATHQPQPIVWLPLDELGIARDEVRRNRKEGVKSTTRNAVFDAHNRVLVKGPAPDDK